MSDGFVVFTVRVMLRVDGELWEPVTTYRGCHVFLRPMKCILVRSHLASLHLVLLSRGCSTAEAGLRVTGVHMTISPV